MGFNQEEYFSALKNALILNGFSSNLNIQESSLLGRLKSWWHDAPTATIDIKNFRLGTDRIGAGGYSRLNDPQSIIVYNELNSQRSGREIPLWMYVNASMHEIGHALFGFNHDHNGFTDDPSSIMDYRSSYKYGAGFNTAQQNIIINSVWGR
jgi:hypothetical protein